MRDDTHDRSTVIDRVEPTAAEHPARPRIDVDDPGPAETAWRAAIDRAALPRWDPGPAGVVLVVSPHPDDETLAVGGVLHDLVAAGWRVRLASVTDGEAAVSGGSGLGAVRRRELASALDRLGIADATVVHRLELPDGHVAQCQAALEARLTPLVAGMSWVLAPWPDDGHPDHEACGRAAAAVVARGAAAAIPHSILPGMGLAMGRARITGGAHHARLRRAPRPVAPRPSCQARRAPRIRKPAGRHARARRSCPRTCWIASPGPSRSAAMSGPA
jgi:LmbE family N-acetylglucosaminyl deacetylase